MNYMPEQQRVSAGYHMLMILSAVDFNFHKAEGEVIQDWLIAEFETEIDLDAELAVLTQLHPNDWVKHFDTQLQLYFELANPTQRIDILIFAKRLIEADNHLHEKENIFFNHLKQHWKDNGVIA